jgi:ATP-dependent protease ClpP protease subunit
LPGWNDLLVEIRAAGTAHDVVRRKYLKQLSDLTGRNAIIYYSGWLQKGDFQRQGITGFEVNDEDKNGFMATIHELDRSKGLDLILHTPGGSTAATESIVDYLRTMFGTDIRAIVPQLALSAGTMIALACKEIVMGKHSSLGPIDPQYAGLPAHGVVEEFNRAAAEIQENNVMALVWQPIINKYTPTLIGECQKAIAWSEAMVRSWLRSGMLAADPDKDSKIDAIIKAFGDHALTLSHDRHLDIKHVKDAGVIAASLEDDQELQEAVLTVHHAAVQTFSDTGCVKVIENQNGVAHIRAIQVAAVQVRPN